MKAMLLAAGRGERLRPLTDVCPKPLTPIAEHRLLEYALHALAGAGVSECVVNMSWLAEQLPATLGDGQRYGLKLHYSDESQEKLETGGGILKALPLLGEQPFLLANGDVLSDYPFEKLSHLQRNWPQGRLAHLVLVPNPVQHPQGDFYLDPEARQEEQSGQKYTYAGLAVIHPELFVGCQPGVFSIVPLLRRAISQGRLSTELFMGYWNDVGTPERLALARAHQAGLEARKVQDP